MWLQELPMDLERGFHDQGVKAERLGVLATPPPVMVLGRGFHDPGAIAERLGVHL